MLLGGAPAAAFDARVRWSSVDSIAGYRVYVRQGTQPYGLGSDVGLLPGDGAGAVTYTARSLPEGITNYVCVTSYDAAGVESALSNELSVYVSPTPGVTGTPVASPTPQPPSTAVPTVTRTPAAPTSTLAPTSTRTVPMTPTAAVAATATSTPALGNFTIWPANATPALAADPDTDAQELGVKFTSDADGWITGIRFYKSTANTGVHTGSLWSTAGMRLATATFSNETASGWQQVDFASPVAITANTIYVASYHTDVGRYAVTENYFTSGGFDRPPLHALPNGSGGNGVYALGASQFPTRTYLGTNYWVDVVFTANAVPPATGTPIISPTPQPSSTAVPTSTRTALPTSTRTAVPTSTATAIPTSTWSPTPPPTTTRSMTASVTRTPTATAPATSTATASRSATRTATSLPPTATLTATRTSTVRPTATATRTQTPTRTGTATRTVPIPASPTPTVTPVPVGLTIWPAAATPALAADPDTAAQELGVKFTSDVDGWITGIRFYKSTANTGVHTGSLWTSSGTRLATATFSKETKSGWQQVSFAAPVAITANTVYVASYYTTVGRYSVTEYYFSGAGFDRPPLHALRDGASGGNGVYALGASQFPTNTYLGTNYWVDVIFTAR